MTKRYKTGTRFRVSGFPERYILAQIEARQFNLISLDDGNRLGETVNVQLGASRGLTLAEIQPIARQRKFTPVKKTGKKGRVN